MTRAGAFNLAAVLLGAFALAYPLVPKPEAGGALIAAGPLLVFGLLLALAGALGLMSRYLSRARRIGIVLLCVSALVMAVSFNVFLDRMTWNDHDPRGVLYSAILAAIGAACFLVKPKSVPAKR